MSKKLVFFRRRKNKKQPFQSSECMAVNYSMKKKNKNQTKFDRKKENKLSTIFFFLKKKGSDIFLSEWLMNFYREN